MEEEEVQEVQQEQEQILDFGEFLKVIKNYSYEIAKQLRQHPPSISIQDVAIIDDLLQEAGFICELLVNNGNTDLPLMILDICLTIIDNLTIIFEKMPIDNRQEFKDLDKIRYPMALKKTYVQIKFDILFRILKNYELAEPLIDDMIFLDTFMPEATVFNQAMENYLGATIKFKLKKYNKALFYAKNCLKFLDEYGQQKQEEYKQCKEENSKDNNNNTENSSQRNEEEVLHIKKISNILNLIGKIYEIKNDSKNAMDFYQKNFYLNMGKFGKTSLKAIEAKKTFDDYKNKIKNQIKPKNKKSNVNNTRKSNDNSKTENEENMNKYKDDKFYLYLMKYKKDVQHTGETNNFSFYIKNSEIYEPLLISIYFKNKNIPDQFNPKLFLQNLFFDKQKLLKTFAKGEPDDNNIIIYSDAFLQEIIDKIYVKNKTLTITDKKLRDCIIQLY